MCDAQEFLLIKIVWNNPSDFQWAKTDHMPEMEYLPMGSLISNKCSTLDFLAEIA